MKKFCFCIFLIFAVCIFFLFSCRKAKSLYDVILFVTHNENSLPAGKIMCYGNQYESSMSSDTLSDYLGLEGYPDFKYNIEDLAIYSSLNGDYCELAAMRLYRASDVNDGKLFFERRIKAVERVLNISGKKGYADKAYIKIYGNTIVLFMMPDNKAIEKKIGNKI